MKACLEVPTLGQARRSMSEGQGHEIAWGFLREGRAGVHIRGEVTSECRCRVRED